MGFVQPQVQRELSTLAHRASNQSNANQRHHGRVNFSGLGPGRQLPEVPGMGQGIDSQYPHQQHQIPNSLGEESVPRPGYHQGLVVPEAPPAGKCPGSKSPTACRRRTGNCRAPGRTNPLQTAPSWRKTGPSPSPSPGIPRHRSGPAGSSR